MPVMVQSRRSHHLDFSNMWLTSNFQTLFLKQWLDIFTKYLRYKLIVVVLRCHPSEESVGLVNFKKKSEGDVSPGSRST